MKYTNELITENMNLVYGVYNDLFKNTSYFIDKDDMIGEGMLALVKAGNTFQDSKGKFSTYAYVCIKNAMTNYANKEFKHKNNVRLFSEDAF